MSLRLGGLEAWRLGVDICQLMTNRYVRNTLIGGLNRNRHYTTQRGLISQCHLAKNFAAFRERKQSKGDLGVGASLTMHHCSVELTREARYDTTSERPGKHLRDPNSANGSILGMSDCTELNKTIAT